MKPKLRVFVVGLCSGNSKPKNVGEYMNGAIRKLGDLLKRGINMRHNGQHLKVALHSVEADAPARSFIKHVVLHSEYASRFRVSLRHKLIFPTNSGRLRTDEDF